MFQTSARHARSMANYLESRALTRTVVLCFLVALCEGFDIQAAGIAAAGLRHELHPSPRVLGLFFSAIGAGLFLGALIGGRTSDLVGRKPVFVASIVAFGLCCLLTSMAPDGRLGSLVGPLVAGMLLAAGRSPAQVMIGILPIVLVGGASVALLGWRNLASSSAHGR